MRQGSGPDRAVAGPLIPPDTVYDFNLLVSRSRGGYQRARRDLANDAREAPIHPLSPA
jgi:hypothetical protein